MTTINEMPDLAHRLRDYWSGLGVKLRPGASAEAIEQFQARFGVCLSRELYQYFSVVDGMHLDDSDKRVCSFWRLERIVRAREVFLTEEELPQGNELRNKDHDKYYNLLSASIYRKRLERWRRQAREEGPRASFPAAAFDPDS
ncbi:MAG TPA: hypothetical protein VGZ22_02030, partial [Isosphaeraceae bacterium]|nr:hypothetical protein [Isosphaeraceae bacterium]